MPRPISEASGDRIVIKLASAEPSVLVNGLGEVSVLRRVPRHTRDEVCSRELYASAPDGVHYRQWPAQLNEALLRTGPSRILHEWSPHQGCRLPSNSWNIVPHGDWLE